MRSAFGGAGAGRPLALLGRRRTAPATRLPTPRCAWSAAGSRRAAGTPVCWVVPATWQRRAPMRSSGCGARSARRWAVLPCRRRLPRARRYETKRAAARSVAGRARRPSRLEGNTHVAARAALELADCWRGVKTAEMADCVCTLRTTIRRGTRAKNGAQSALREGGSEREWSNRRQVSAPEHGQRRDRRYPLARGRTPSRPANRTPGGAGRADEGHGSGDLVRKQDQARRRRRGARGQRQQSARAAILGPAGTYAPDGRRLSSHMQESTPSASARQ